MYSAIKKSAPILALSAFVVTILNYFSFQAIIQTQTDTVPTKLILEIIFTILTHIAALSAVPLILSAKNRKLTSYVTLVILGAIYTTLMTGINVAGPAVAIVALCYLAYYGYTKAQGIFRYYRTK